MRCIRLSNFFFLLLLVSAGIFACGESRIKKSTIGKEKIGSREIELEDHIRIRKEIVDRQLDSLLRINNIMKDDGNVELKILKSSANLDKEKLVILSSDNKVWTATYIEFRCLFDNEHDSIGVELQRVTTQKSKLKFDAVTDSLSHYRVCELKDDSGTPGFEISTDPSRVSVECFINAASKKVELLSPEVNWKSFESSKNILLTMDFIDRTFGLGKEFTFLYDGPL